MSKRVRNGVGREAGAVDPPPLHDGEVVEVPLLLPGWQVTALEEAAHRRGLTAAAMVRNLLRDFIAGVPARGG